MSLQFVVPYIILEQKFITSQAKMVRVFKLSGADGKRQAKNGRHTYNEPDSHEAVREYVCDDWQTKAAFDAVLVL